MVTGQAYFDTPLPLNLLGREPPQEGLPTLLQLIHVSYGPNLGWGVPIGDYIGFWGGPINGSNSKEEVMIRDGLILVPKPKP